MIHNDVDMRSYQKRVNEFIKVIQFQIVNNVGYIELHDYTKSYNLNKSQLVGILKEKKLLNKFNEYNNKFI
jgi:hypothetical protein